VSRACRAGVEPSHSIYAPGYYTDATEKTLPGIREAIEQRDWKEATSRSNRRCVLDKVAKRSRDRAMQRLDETHGAAAIAIPLAACPRYNPGADAGDGDV